jgi:hypothetical protein
MRKDTPLGPVWLVPDQLGETAAKHVVRLELMLPNLDGIVAAHTGPRIGGAFVVRAPRAALEAAGYPITSAAELPTEEGKAWPPISEEGQKILRAAELLERD